MDTKTLISSIDAEIERLTQARDLLSDRKAPRSAKSKSTERKPRKALSPEARARIAAAQKKRWAAHKKAAKTAAK